MMHHRRARSGRADNRIGLALFAQFYKSLGYPTCFVSVTCIESRLTTAGLPLVELDRAACSLEHLDRTRADAAPHLIHKTGHEQTDLDCRFAIADCRFEIPINHTAAWARLTEFAAAPTINGSIAINRQSTMLECDDSLDVVGCEVVFGQSVLNRAERAVA